MSAQSTQPALTARDVNQALEEFRRRALQLHDDLRHYAGQCLIRREISDSEGNAANVDRFEKIRQRAEQRAAMAFEFVQWSDDARRDWATGRLSPRIVVGNIRLAEQCLAIIEHPAGQQQ